jgi:hypothetical protein
LADSWLLLPDTLPAIGRYGCINTIIDSFAYFIGGFPLMSNTSLSLNDIGATTFRIVSGILSIPFQMVEEIYVSPMVLIAFVLAGYGAYDYGLRHDFYKYNLHTSILSPIIVQNFPDSIAGGQNSCFAYHNTIYFFGGAQDT